MKWLIFVFFAVLLMPAVFADGCVVEEVCTWWAYDSSEEATAVNIAIYAPNGSVVINDSAMNKKSGGYFNYDVVLNATGNYAATSTFYNSSNSSIGTASESRQVSKDSEGNTTVNSGSSRSFSNYYIISPNGTESRKFVGDIFFKEDSTNNSYTINFNKEDSENFLNENTVSVLGYAIPNWLLAACLTLIILGIIFWFVGLIGVRRRFR